MFHRELHFEQVPLAVALKKAEEEQSNENKQPKKRLTVNGRIENGRSQNARSNDGRIEARS